MSNRKSVLIVISGMEIGGAQKSLISFLKSLEEAGLSTQYEVDVIVGRPKGLFMNQFPSFVNVLPTPPELVWLGTPHGDELLAKYSSLRGRIGKLTWMLTNKQRVFHNKLNEEQRIWVNWRHLVPALQKHYDVAISYMNGFPGYYVMDKVNAKRKILWIHNEYQKLGYNTDFDRPFYASCDQVVTISDACVESFTQAFPEFADKTILLYNITLVSDVLAKGARNDAPEFEQTRALRILSVGRLAAQKQFGLAIQTAAALKQRGVDFLWLIVGDGPDRELLQAQIDERGLQDSMKLVGQRANPYAYMARCDVFVQTSLYEGKSIVLDEAKLFGKPIVVTDYPTASDIIQHDRNGLICPMDAQKLADAIECVTEDEALRQRFADALAAETGSQDELRKYIDAML